MTLDPIRKRITVPVDPDEAFALFTERVGEWWPMETHSCSGEAAAAVRFEARVGGRILETATDGTEHAWGTLTAWDPPARFACRWHPGHDAGSATDLEVTFVANPAAGTDVVLVHGGWEALGDASDGMHAAYGSGWDMVLGRMPGAVVAVSPAG